MNNKKLVITIARECGSGGHEIARQLAEYFKIPLYDAEIIDTVARENMLSSQAVANADERVQHFYMMSPMIFYGSSPWFDSSFCEVVYNAEADVILRAEKQGSCVIVGRCADSILDEKDTFRVFVHADLDYRVKNKMEETNDPKMKNYKAMRRYVLSVDKDRARYYAYYSNKKWGKAQNYDICIATDTFGIDVATKLIIDAIENRK